MAGILEEQLLLVAGILGYNNSRITYPGGRDDRYDSMTATLGDRDIKV